MPVGVGSWLPAVEVGWWDPLSVAVAVGAGFPAAGLQHAVVGAAGEGELVDVGGVAGGVVGDVVDFAVVAAHGAAGLRAILGYQKSSMHESGDSRFQ